ncbi:hypothetical protein ES705_38635 [subsurface metagenome]
MDIAPKAVAAAIAAIVARFIHFEKPLENFSTTPDALSLAFI